jgi:hypothetical protein
MPVALLSRFLQGPIGEFKGRYTTDGSAFCVDWVTDGDIATGLLTGALRPQVRERSSLSIEEVVDFPVMICTGCSFVGLGTTTGVEVGEGATDMTTVGDVAAMMPAGRVIVAG